MQVLYRFQRTAINSLLLYRLLHALLYIFSEISTYLYDFQRVTTRYHHIFLKRSILTLILKKLVVTRGNKNGATNKNGAKFP